MNETASLVTTNEEDIPQELGYGNHAQINLLNTLHVYMHVIMIRSLHCR